MNKEDKTKVFAIALCGILIVLLLIIGANVSHMTTNRQMVSYEYTTQCRCGGTIEGYQSLVDGFNQEECNKCGYHKEGK